MSTQLEIYAKQLTPFLPLGTENYIAELIIENKTKFKISKKRKTKLGDYKIPFNGEGHRISVNGDLNQYAFLITTIHEFAHLKAFEYHGLKIKPHGIEWKSEFSKLFQPIFGLSILPDDVKSALTKYLKNAKASSCTDEALYRVLKRYDKGEALLVEHLKPGETFKLNNHIFEKGKKIKKVLSLQKFEKQ